jgi:hypothetical protein
MPSLKQLTCSVELGSSNTKIPEYGKDYGDGHVTSYITVPNEEVTFSIHLTSQGYIAPGLAMFVYMDGQYQCNRNRRGLLVANKGLKSEHTEVDFRVRQKESKQADGTFLGRDWTFAGLNLVSAEKVKETNDVFLDNLGTVEVIVLRCKDAPPPPLEKRERSSRPASKPVSKHSAPQQEQKEPFKPSSSSHKKKEPFAKAKEPSKTHSKRATAETVKESSIGGMFGLFDGASDEPDHHSINPKPYWNDWNKRPSIPSPRRLRDVYIAPEEPMPLVPKQAARAKRVEHQVKTGKGAQYIHLCARPEYLDSMQQPYAVFTFKYRSKRFIEKKFKIEVKDEGKAFKAKLADMSKDELAEELYRLRVSCNPTCHGKQITDEIQMAAENSSKNQSKKKTPSKEKTPNVAKTSGPHELPTHRTPTKSKSNKEAAAPAPNWDPPTATGGWIIPPDQDWTNPANPVGSKPATKVSFKNPSKVPSQTASQKASQTPGSYPKSASSHHTATQAAAARSAAKSAAKKSASKKPNKEEPAAAAGAENWNQPRQDNTWDNAPAGVWDGGAATAGGSMKW